MVNPLFVPLFAIAFFFFKALDFLYHQYIHAMDYQNGILPRANLPTYANSFRRKYCLQCCHKILERLGAVGPLSVEDCERHWWIRFQNPELFHRLQELDPNVIPPYGRPMNGPIAFQNNRTDNTTGRDLSHNEITGRKGRVGS